MKIEDVCEGQGRGGRRRDGEMRDGVGRFLVGPSFVSSLVVRTSMYCTVCLIT